MLQKFIYSILLFCAFNNLNAQSSLYILNKEQKPLENAAIYFKCVEPNCNLKSGLVFSDKNGKAQFPEHKNLALDIHLVGYNSLNILFEPKQNNSIVLTANNTDFNEYVVTAQYEETSVQKAVQKIKVIDRKRIDAQGAVNLKDLLTNELNIRVSQDNMLGSGITMQGISGQNVKILINGVPLIGRMNGNIDISQINLNNIERIEIIEGPMSVAYGTDALGGVINLITKNTKTSSVNVNTYTESVGQYNINGGVSFAKNKHQFSLNAGRNLFDGYTSTQFYNNNVKPYINNAEYSNVYNRKQQWLPKTQLFSDINYTYKLNNGDITFQSSIFKEDVINKGLPTITNYDAYALDDYFKTYRINNYAFINYKFKNKANLNLINAVSLFERHKNTYRKNLVTLSENLVPNTEDQSKVAFNSLNFRGTYSTQQHSKINYQLGYDINYETSSGDRLKTGANLTDLATFLSLDYKPINRLNIRPAVRASYNSRYSSPLVPSLNLKYDVNSNIVLRGSYGLGFRAPSLKELDLFFFDFNHSIQGNTNLRAEKSHNLNLFLTFKKNFTGKSLSIEPSIFYNQINNMISLAIVDFNRTPPLYTYINIDTYKTMGSSINTEFKTEQFTINAGANYTGRYNLGSAENSNIKPFSYSPEFRTAITYNLVKLHANFAIFYKYTGKLPGYSLVNNEVAQTMIDDYNTLDLTASKYLINTKLKIQVGAKNIFNVTNINSTSVGGAHSAGGAMPVFWGRTYFASLMFNFNTN